VLKMSSEKQSESTSFFACSHCDRILANKNSLGRHEILKYNWDIASEKTVTADVARATREKNPGKQSART